MARRSLSGTRIIVTGASSGIGRALALQLCSRGAHVLATARRESRLKDLIAQSQPNPGSISAPGRGPQTSVGSITGLAGDITESEHRTRLIAWCHEHWGAIDVLINNAGAGAIGAFRDASQDRLRQVMEVDFFAPVELTRIALPLLEKGTRPAILNIGSVLSHRAVPNKSEYCAAKFAMRGWAESLRVELAPRGIEVLMVSPSTTKSEFFDVLLDTPTGTTSKSMGMMSPERVAKIAISSLVRSKREMIVSFGGKALVWAGRLLPNLTDRILGRFANG